MCNKRTSLPSTYSTTMESHVAVIHRSLMVCHQLSSRFGKVSGIYVASADAIRATMLLIKSKSTSSCTCCPQSAAQLPAAPPAAPRLHPQVLIRELTPSFVFPPVILPTDEPTQLHRWRYQRLSWTQTHPLQELMSFIRREEREEVQLCCIFRWDEVKIMFVFSTIDHNDVGFFGGWGGTIDGDIKQVCSEEKKKKKKTLLFTHKQLNGIFRGDVQPASFQELHFKWPCMWTKSEGE